MKKRFAIILSSILLAFCVSACNDTSGTDSEAKQSFSGISLIDAQFTYDGQPHAIAVNGDLPENTKVTYVNNDKTVVGEYTVTATLTNPDYVTKTLSGKMIINKAEFTGITFVDKSFVYTGKEQSLTVSGDLPENTEVFYANNDKIEVGEYTVTAMLTNPNYVTKTLSAKMSIVAKTDIALSIINSILDKPEPWDFLPSAFLPKNMAHATQPVGGLEGFATDVSVSSISAKCIGKQFNVLYEGLLNTSSVLSKADLVFSIGGTIAEAYQTFINDNPNDHATFVGVAGGFKIKIVIDGDESTLLAGNSALNMELHYSSKNKERMGRIQLSDGIAIKYTAGEDSLKLAVKTTVSGVGNLKEMEFVRDGNAVVGYLREFTGTETKNIKTSGVIMSNAEITCIMSDKRETDDLKINGYEEVYSSVTGEFIGGRILETVKICDYDTMCFGLKDVTGFMSVRVDASDDIDPDSIYVNGRSTVFETKKVGGLGADMLSRRYYIEMRDVWYAVAKTSGDKTEYEVIKTSVPMLFVQKQSANTFAADVTEKNPYITATALPVDNITKVDSNFDALKTLFDTVKEDVTYTDIQAYIGDKNEFFDTTE